MLANTMSSVLEEDRLEKFSSGKTLSLLKLIREIAQDFRNDVRMIVFVEERATATGLAQILNAAGIPNVRAASVFGVTAGSMDLSAKLVAKVNYISSFGKNVTLIVWPL